MPASRSLGSGAVDWKSPVRAFACPERSVEAAPVGIWLYR